MKKIANVVAALNLFVKACWSRDSERCHVEVQGYSEQGTLFWDFFFLVRVVCLFITSCGNSRRGVFDVDFERASHQHVDVLRDMRADGFETCSVMVSSSNSHGISLAMARAQAAGPTMTPGWRSKKQLQFGALHLPFGVQ